MNTLGSINILHVAAVGHQNFGVGAAVLGLAKAQMGLGALATLWTTDSEKESAEIRLRHSFSSDTFVDFPVLGPSRFGYSPAMERAAKGLPPRSNCVLHQHGVWPARAKATLCWKRSVKGPTIIAAHGELRSYPLSLSKLKKWIAYHTYVRKNFQLASCLHALSEAEMTSYRSFGLMNPVAIIPNGVDDSLHQTIGNAERFRAQFSLATDRRLLVFLSRVTPIKGIPMLLEAMASLRYQLKDWLLVIVGPDEFGHIRELRSLIDKLSLSESVRFTGPLFNEARHDALAAADVFVLPSYSEGAPMTVLEALGAGVPVLTTHGAPCEYLLEHGCGWWTAINSAGIAEGLAQAVSQPKHVLVEMESQGFSTGSRPVFLVPNRPANS